MGAPTSPIPVNLPISTLHEVLVNVFKSLLSPKDRAAGPGTSVLSHGATVGKPPAIGPRTSGGSAGDGASWSESGGP